ncbi:MAG: hypothetical protein WA061_03465 [Microgenomates group bacterium]
MTFPQRIILIVTGTIFTILVSAVIFSSSLHLADLFTLTFILFISAALFYFALSDSSASQQKSDISNTNSYLFGRYSNGNSKKIDNLLQMTRHRLYKLSSVFPFDLFPDQIFIEQKQVIIICKQFFATSQDYQILINHILMPVVENSVFFSTFRLEVAPGGIQQNPPAIQYLKKSEALKAKRIITGLMICDKEKVDLSLLSPQEVLKKVEEIGRFRVD